MVSVHSAFPTSILLISCGNKLQILQWCWIRNTLQPVCALFYWFCFVDNSPCTIKSRSSLLAPTHPGGPGKRAVKQLWCGGVVLLITSGKCNTRVLNVRAGTIWRSLTWSLCKAKVATATSVLATANPVHRSRWRSRWVTNSSSSATVSCVQHCATLLRSCHGDAFWNQYGTGIENRRNGAAPHPSRVQWRWRMINGDFLWLWCLLRPDFSDCFALLVWWQKGYPAHKTVLLSPIGFLPKQMAENWWWNV